MSISPLPPTPDYPAYMSGDVTIHPQATIATGVIIQATPNSRIVIAAGVCIGTDCVLQVHNGTLTVEEGATLGSGVLMIGAGAIGAYACIGASVTILNASVASHQVIPCGSRLGDMSRLVAIDPVTAQAETPTETNGAKAEAPLPPESLDHAVAEAIADPFAPEPEPQRSQPAPTPEPVPEPVSEQHNEVTTNGTAAATDNAAANPSNSANPKIYGQQQLKQLLTTMFPYGQSVNSLPSSDQ